MTEAFPFSIPVMDVIRHDYERFRFDTHQYDHKGLFTDGESLYAVVLDVEGNDTLLDELNEHYRKYHTAGIPTGKIVGQVSKGFQLIESRSRLEKALTHGQPMTVNEVINYLNLHIPRKYHPFHFDFKFNTNVFLFLSKERLNEEEKEEIQLICESIGYQGYDFVFEHKPEINEYPGVVEYESNQHNNLMLTA
ncbi:hypothetical protein [Vibrio sp. Hep-1b-8]|uniref:hypothetical protein n=1 Tax=Vibrio sp. Hep-1b-8 TaxID=2144187 RepID=UPI001F0CDE7F|nr:hypothetical protein [Vibrio sp. Hep-1b-8]